MHLVNRYLDLLTEIYYNTGHKECENLTGRCLQYFQKYQVHLLNSVVNTRCNSVMIDELRRFYLTDNI